MPKQEFKARDKTVEKMGRDGLMRENLRSGEVVKAGRREAESLDRTVQGTEPVNLQKLRVHRADQDQKEEKCRRKHAQCSGFRIDTGASFCGQEKKLDQGAPSYISESEEKGESVPDAGRQDRGFLPGLECAEDTYRPASQALSCGSDSGGGPVREKRFFEHSLRLESLRPFEIRDSGEISGRSDQKQRNPQAQEEEKKELPESAAGEPPVHGRSVPDVPSKPERGLPEHSFRMQNVRPFETPSYRKMPEEPSGGQKNPQIQKENPQVPPETDNLIETVHRGNQETAGHRKDKEYPTNFSRLSFEDEGGMARGAGIKKRAASAVFDSARAYIRSGEQEEEQNHTAAEILNKAGHAGEGILLYSLYSSRRRKRRESSRFSEKETGTQKERLRFEEARKPESEAANRARQEEEKAVRKSFQKKQYKNAYQRAENGTNPAPDAANAVQTITGKAKRAVTKAAKNIGILFRAAIAVTLLLGFVSTGLSSCGAMIPGAGSIIIGTTYPSTDEDIYAAEAHYSALEDALNRQINNMESTHPGYDEYRYQVDEISHNPYHLISYLTVVFQEFTYEQVKDALQELFSGQYRLKIKEIVETRTRINSHGHEEEYDYYILCISLTNLGFDTVAKSFLTPEQAELYDVYNITCGNRDYLFDKETIPGPDNSGGGGFDIPGEALSDQKFANMIREAEKYLGYPYVWGGDSPSTGFDCSGFVSWVINHCGNGWNVGRQTAEGLRNCCAYVSPADARPGDLIFFQGTYQTPGASHVGIYVGSNMMIHCGNPIQYTNINSPYWKQHFLAFGRIQ